MKQLKDAFIKAGIISKEEAEKKKPEPLLTPKKGKPPSRELKKYHEHQAKTECELCGKYSPDVEYYRHEDKRIVKRWLCMRCADDNSIHDDLRQTNQSPYAMTGHFIRQYGPTKKFEK